MKKKVLFVFGTRPEAIKLVPLIRRMSLEPDFDCRVCVTGQHKAMLDQVLDFFCIKPDYDLKLMKNDQTLSEITTRAISGLEEIIRTQFYPEYMVVQGDTTSAFCGALAAFYARVKVIHIEAGFRSFDKYAPFPEEINRKLIAHLADFHFAPTPRCVENLITENVDPKSIWSVGNTVIDALLLGLDIIEKQHKNVYENFFSYLDPAKKVILVTGHRRENFGQPIIDICNAVKTIAAENPDYEVVYPLHLNPNSRKPVMEILSGSPRIHLIEPLDYPYLIWLLNRCSLVITDSGGIQEEAATLGKPVLIIRHVTERMEGVEAGTAKLVGTDYDNIVNESNKLLRSSEHYEQMARAVNPYGDGTSCEQIITILQGVLQTSTVGITA